MSFKVIFKIYYEMKMKVDFEWIFSFLPKEYFAFFQTSWMSG